MKIVRLTVENVKKLKAVEISPEGNVVEVNGKNGSGKSSVLDAIWWALSGAKHIQSQPIRSGEETAHITLDLGKLLVERKFTAKGSSLSVTTEDGARFPSPQSMLDDLVGALSFDPLAFSRMDSKAQYNALRNIVNLDVDITALDRANSEDYDNRRNINRDAKEIRARADGIGIDEEAPDNLVNVDALIDKLQKAGDHNSIREKWKLKVEHCESEVAEYNASIEELVAKLSDARDDHVGLLARLEKLKEAEPAGLIDTEELRGEIDNANAINRRVEQNKRVASLIADSKSKEDEGDKLTDAMADREKQKRDAIAKAKLPVEGLGFGASEILMNDVPFVQASSAEQLRVSVAIAMAMNPELRVLRIKDGSLLDKDAMKVLAGMAELSDYQIWIERVESSGAMGVLMEDGSVIKVRKSKATAA